jgi:hypothetical protein
MKKVILCMCVYLILSVVTYATTFTTNSSGIFTDISIWSPTLNLSNNDTLIVNHDVIISGNINWISLNIVIILNAEMLFESTAKLRLGSESIIMVTTTGSIKASGGPGNSDNNNFIDIGEMKYQGSDFYHFKPGEILTNNGVLPVDLLSFDIRLENNQPVLTWVTVKEFNNKEFIIKRSVDINPLKFETISIIEGNGNSSETNTYTYIDKEIIPTNRVYYQLFQIDYDETIHYLGIVTINMETKTIAGIEIPASDRVIEIQYFSFNGDRLSTIDGYNKYIVVLITDKKKYTKKYFKF